VRWSGVALLLLGAGVLPQAAAAVGIAFAAFPANSPTSGVAQPTSGGDATAPGPLTFRSDELGKQQLDATKNKNDYGPFSDKQKLAACLQANGISAAADPLGGRQVRVDGKAGTLLVFAHGAGQFRLIVVGPDCGAGNPSKLADKTI